MATYNLGSGNNTMTMPYAGANTINGGDGNDYILGNTSGDRLNGDNGHDTVYASGGNDSIYGGAGDDDLYGQNENDLIYGQDGFDWIFGGENNDTLYGGNSDDLIYGDNQNGTGTGQDRLIGGPGSDSLYGGAADDMYLFTFGTDGIDYIYESSGDYDKLVLSSITYSDIVVTNGTVLGFNSNDMVIFSYNDSLDGTISHAIVVKDHFISGGAVELINVSGFDYSWVDLYA